MADGTEILNNRSLLQKADLAIADLTSSGGVLQLQQAQKFIRLLIDESRLLKVATVTPMKGPKQLVEKIRFASRILHAANEAVELPVGQRSKPNLSKVELDAQLFKAEVRLSNETLEDSIERGDLRNTIMELMGESISRDMEEIVVKGDTTSSDPDLSLFDGVLAGATSNIVDAATTSTNKGMFRDMLKTMPSPFLRNKSAMRFFTSIDSEIDYRDSLSDRLTVSGDKALADDAPVGYSGVPVMDIPLFPENLGGGTNCTNMLLTDPKNFNVGIWRQIRIETDKLISQGVLLIVCTLRFDFKYVEETAVVKAINVKVA